MLKTNLERIKAGISYFKVLKGKENNPLVIREFWEFIKLVERYINGDNVPEEAPDILETANDIFNSGELPIKIPLDNTKEI